MRYLLKLVEQSWFHYSFEYLVMCFSFEYLFHAFLNTWASCWTKFSRSLLDWMFDEFRLNTSLVSDTIKFFSSLLSLLIDLILRSISVSAIPTLIISGT